jgi:hypothetical protein
MRLIGPDEGLHLQREENRCAEWERRLPRNWGLRLGIFRRFRFNNDDRFKSRFSEFHQHHF